MALREARILFKNRVVGSLVETANGGTRFSYDAGWGKDIACCFPAARREHEWAQGLHPFFQHLGPEGWLRQEQARVSHIEEEDDLGLLLRYGADCIGAVSIEPVDEVAPGAEVTELQASPGRTVSGVQKKLLVTRDGSKGAFHPAGPRGEAPFIAKFNSERLGTLVRNEFLSLRWVQAVLGKDEVTDFTLSSVRMNGGNETALVVTRFDRTAKGEKLRLEDFAQILCKPRGRDYAGKYDASYEDVADVIRRYSARPEIDLAKLFRRLVAFAAIGNCDAHLKNFSLLETPVGLRLSPAYDVVNTAIYEGFDQELALSMGGRKIAFEEVSAPLLADFGRRIDLPERAVEQSLAELKREVRKARDVIPVPEGEGPDGFLTRFTETVDNACLRLFGE